MVKVKLMINVLDSFLFIVRLVALTSQPPEIFLDGR